MARAIKFSSKLYFSASANGEIASGIAASMIDGAKFSIEILKKIFCAKKIAGKIKSEKIEKRKIGAQFCFSRQFIFPTKSPITISTIGVTEFASIFADSCKILGSGISKIAKKIPAKTEIKSGFFAKFFQKFFPIFLFFCHSKNPTPKVKIQKI